MRANREIPSTPFTWPMARDLGWSRSDLRIAVDTREVRKVMRNVYLRTDIEDTQAVRAAAARLVLSPFTVARDRTAAWLLGVDTFEYQELEILPPLETCVFRGHNRTRRAEVDGGVRDLRPHDVMTVAGVRCTTPLRTALDLACHQSRRRALAALDAFMHHHGLSHFEMQRELTRYFRRRGVVQARQLVPLADPPVDLRRTTGAPTGFVNTGAYST
jgi:hypothetical protein